MHEEVIISGFGGQGALFAGQLLTYTGLDEGWHVTWIPSYGPEMRGGTAHCIVIISDDDIGSPYQLFEDLGTLRRLQIEGDTALVQIQQ